MSSKVIDTIRLWRRTSFIWGANDCFLSVADYVRDVTGIDPAKPWRGIYATQDGAKALADGYGGQLALARHSMALAGFVTCPSAFGCPVVCRFGDAEIAGIKLDRRVAFRTERGVVEMPAEILEAWNICG